MLILITICRIVLIYMLYLCLSAYLQSLFLAARLVLIPFESQQEGTSADHIRNWLDAALDFFHPAGILCNNIFLRDRLPSFIATQFWTSLGKKESTFHVCCLRLFVFLLRFLYWWISFQAPKKESTHVFMGKGTPAQALSTFCSSTQSTDGWSDTRAFILT